MKRRLLDTAVILGICAATLGASCGGMDDQALDETQNAIGGGGQNCTHAAWYWKRFNIYATNPADQIPWPIDENLDQCGHTIFYWATTQPAKGDVLHTLLRQIIIASLNTRSGAITTPEVHEALFNAKILAGSCAISPADEAIAFQYYNTLDLFNRGLIGPGACP